MSKHLLQVLILAAGSDGEIQKEELAIIHKYKEHYPSLKSLSPIEYDTENVAKHMDNPAYIFDDYGLPPGEVRKAILEKINDGTLTLSKPIGEKPDQLVSAAGTKFIDQEGIICNLKE